MRILFAFIFDCLTLFRDEDEDDTEYYNEVLDI